MATNKNNLTDSCYGNLGDVFIAYLHTVRPHAHREPLRVKLVDTNDKVISWTDALIVLNHIAERKNDGVQYWCETELNGEIPETVIARVSCTEYYWRRGENPRPFAEKYDYEKGYYDLFPHNDPFDYICHKPMTLTTICDHNTGEIMKDSEGRNLAVYGWLAWSSLVPAALELYEKGAAFDFCDNGVPGDKLAHIGPKGCLRQNPKTGKWRAAWK